MRLADNVFDTDDDFSDCVNDDVMMMMQMMVNDGR